MKQNVLIFLFGSIFQTALATNATDYFRSVQNGNWNLTTTWQSSSDSVIWNPATRVPDSSAKSITISSGTTVAITTTTTASYVCVLSTATLSHASSISFDLTELLFVQGTYVLNGTQPTFHVGAIADIAGIVRVDGNTGGQSDNFAFNTAVYFENGAVFQWNIPTIFQTANIVYFPNASNDITPIFKITRHVGAIGSTTTTTFNGKFVCDSSIIFQRSGTKVFRDGFGGVGTVTHSQSCGTFSITGAHAVIDGSVSLLIINDTLGLVDMNISTNSSVVVSGSAAISIGTSGSGARLQVDGILTQNSSSAIDISYGSLTINGSILGSGSFKAKRNATDVSINGVASDAGVLRFQNGYDTVRNFSLNRNGGQIHLGSDMVVAATLTLTKGILTTGTYLCSHDNTASYNPPASYTDAFICTCLSNGTTPPFSYPYDRTIGFRLFNVVQNSDAWFPVSSDLVSPNRAYIKNTDSVQDTYTLFIGKGDVGSTPLPNVNRIWYIKNSSSTARATLRLYFTKRDWMQWPDEDEVYSGFNYGDIHVVQKDYNERFQDKSTDADITNFIGTHDSTEIYGQYTVGISTDSVGNRFGITMFSRFVVINIEDMLLPLVRIMFTATQTTRGALLHWGISDRNQLQHFIIERSNDGHIFKTIDSLRVEERLSYMYEDIYQSTIPQYYRIGVVNKNADTIWSRIVVIQNSLISVQVFPNPVTITLFISGIAGEHIPIDIYDVVGRNRVHMYSSSSCMTIDMSSFASGIYLCKVGDASPLKIMKLK